MILEKTRAVSSLDEACATFLGPVKPVLHENRAVAHHALHKNESAETIDAQNTHEIRQKHESDKELRSPEAYHGKDIFQQPAETQSHKRATRE